MSRSKWSRFAALIVVLIAAGPMVMAGDGMYCQQPDIHGDRIVFCAERDIWSVAAGGGTATRLTTHDGNEYFPHFSPDGERVAFSAAYGGNLDVYFIPSGGGEPRRLTWHGGADEVVGWMPDGERVIFRSGRSDPMGTWRLFTVDLQGGDAEELPLGWAARLDVDRDSGLWAFNRRSRDTRNWKRYRGGTATDIWAGDPATGDFRKLTDFDGMDAFPMWHDDRIYFVSDRGGTVNIWSVTRDGSDRRQHTEFDRWDIRWPAMAPDGRIAFCLAADIHVFDPAAGSERKIDVRLPSDRVLTRVRYPDAARSLEWFSLTPEGDRLAVVARGEIFSVPLEDGVTLPVTRGSGAREREASFSPDGERILYTSDQQGDDEFRVIDAWGRGEPEVIKPVSKSKAWHYAPAWSPDGKQVAWSTSDLGLYILPAEGGTVTEVARSGNYAIREYVWSPDGRWLAYTLTLPSEYASIFIYDTKDMETHRVTGDYSDDNSPAWDPDGRYLYYVSSRAVNPFLGQFDWNNVEQKNDKLYMVLLRDDVENPLAETAGLPPEEEPEEDAGEDGDDEGEEGGKKSDKDEEAEDSPEPVEIDTEGLMARTLELPVDRGNYDGLEATAGHLFYVSVPLRGMAEQPGLFEESGPTASLHAFDLKKKESKPFVEGISGYAIAAKGAKMGLLKGPGELYVVDTAAPPGPALAESRIDLSGLVIQLDPREEWAQIYHEAWRRMRDFYWDEEMSGLDWEAIRDQYASLLPRLSSRGDLSDLIGQMFGELNTSHTYVFGGDMGVRVPRVATGLLGADLERQGEAYRVAKIYRGSAPDRVRSPLDEPGVDVGEGDYILAVNRAPFDGSRPIHAWLENLAGRPTLLTVNGEPAMEGAREVLVTPMAREGDLRYSHWVRENRDHVLRKTDGKIGYIHIPDMWTSGLVEFNTWFYPQLDKEGMVVDTRWNGGGAVSQMILERLRRPLLSYSRIRGGGIGSYPDRVLNGPFVVLMNQFNGSDGDIFPKAVQLNGLAPVIGMRSWGGVVGIYGARSLVDGGLVTNPQSAWWDPRDGWGLENHGVNPDIEVENLPQDLARGVDAQLERGIDEVLRLHREDPPLKPDFGDIRDRSRKAFRNE